MMDMDGIKDVCMAKNIEMIDKAGKDSVSENVGLIDRGGMDGVTKAEQQALVEVLCAHLRGWEGQHGQGRSISSSSCMFFSSPQKDGIILKKG